MKLESGLNFTLNYSASADGLTVNHASVQSGRPLYMSQLLRGRRGEEAPPLVAMMFRICGTAHAYAALSAWRLATGVQVSPQLQQAQQLLVRLESVREHLWQVAIVWPELVGEAPRPDEEIKLLSTLMAEMSQALFATGQSMSPQARLAVDTAQVENVLMRLDGLVRRQVSGMAIDQWLAIESLDALAYWAKVHVTPAARLISSVMVRQWQGLGENSVELLPDATVLASKFDVDGRDEFIAQPTWQGRSCETNAYTRQRNQSLVAAVSEAYGPGLLARLVARLVELLSLLQVIRRESLDPMETLRTQDAAMAASGSGLGEADAARGRLVHWMKMEQGVIADYAILAPTEWNFHPAGVAVQGLKTLMADDERQLRQQAAMWINAIDPCVSYELKLESVSDA